MYSYWIGDGWLGLNDYTHYNFSEYCKVCINNMPDVSSMVINFHCKFLLKILLLYGEIFLQRFKKVIFIGLVDIVRVSFVLCSIGYDASVICVNTKALVVCLHAGI